MMELFSELFRKYGASFPIVVCVAMIVVWGISHLVAELGQQVSVFWGMVGYTKKGAGGERAPVIGYASFGAGCRFAARLSCCVKRQKEPFDRDKDG